MQWKCIDTGFRTGRENMEFDLSLVKELENNSGKPTLRFYKWKPFCISTGYHQKQNEINLELCKKDGIEIVTRPTGGRAILHANELTYSVVMNSNGNSVNEVYCEISKAIVTGLNILGAKVEYSKNENNLSTFYKNDKSSFACFATSSKYEIQFEGKKIVGSAQRRFTNKNEDEIILQHGSILLDESHLQISNFYSENIENKKLILKKLSEETSNLKQILGRNLQVEEIQNAVFEGFIKSKIFGFNSTCISKI